jgi:hypothetical protein
MEASTRTIAVNSKPQSVLAAILGAGITYGQLSHGLTTQVFNQARAHAERSAVTVRRLVAGCVYGVNSTVISTPYTP